MSERTTKETFDRSSTDAMVWAEAFVQHKKDNEWSLEEIDKDLMVGWFANAMCAQMDSSDNIRIEELERMLHLRGEELIQNAARNMNLEAENARLRLAAQQPT